MCTLGSGPMLPSRTCIHPDALCVLVANSPQLKFQTKGFAWNFDLRHVWRTRRTAVSSITYSVKVV